MNLSRILFLDRARGLIMIFMALDHALYFWSFGRVSNEGLPLLIKGAVIFNSIGTHNPMALTAMVLASLCAPGFLFIAGYVLAISVKNQTAKKQSRLKINGRLWCRGLLLIAFQLCIASPAFYLPTLIQARTLSIISIGTFFSLSVLSTIGLGFLLLSFARRLSPWKIVGISGLLYIISQLLLPYFTKNFLGMPSWSQAFHTLLVLPIPFSAGLLVNNNFPIIPWFFPMSLGWLYGNTYAEKRGVTYEAKRFLLSGIGSLTLFVTLRFAKLGDFLPPDGTLLGFMGLSKYPPSPDYLFFYLGLLFIIFYFANQLSITSRLGRILENFGQAPLFFYNLHLWLYAAVPAILHKFNRYSLVQGIGIWIIGLFILYPLCRVYLVHQSLSKVPKLRTEIAPEFKTVRASKSQDIIYTYGKE